MFARPKLAGDVLQGLDPALPRKAWASLQHITGTSTNPRCNGPLCQPARPGLSLSGCRFRMCMHTLGRPVLPLSPSCARDAANTPPERPDARFADGGSLPQAYGRSTSALSFSRPARRSLALHPAGLRNSPKRSPSHRSASRLVVTFTARSDGFRRERELARRVSPPLKFSALARRDSPLKVAVWVTAAVWSVVLHLPQGVRAQGEWLPIARRLARMGPASAGA